MAKVRMTMNRVGEIEKALKESASGTVTLSELLDTGFLARHTKYQTFEALASAAGFDLEAVTGWESFDAESLSQFLVQNTPFKSFDDLRRAAVMERTASVRDKILGH